ncbi:MAG: HTH domain-containing protein [Lachnospiraceae bacterium]|nr:HTH domain-containing protein [Lachnospiraceae bacterium]RKJ63003.1 HTH domain-containing protein [Roseburia sp. 1XD42-69]
MFSTIFIAGNRLQALFDNRIPQVSLKQFMLLSILRQSEEPMTFTQLGTLLGCSRQNIKKYIEPILQCLKQ